MLEGNCSVFGINCTAHTCRWRVTVLLTRPSEGAAASITQSSLCRSKRGTLTIGWTGNSALITQHNGQEGKGGRDLARVRACAALDHAILPFSLIKLKKKERRESADLWFLPPRSCAIYLTNCRSLWKLLFLQEITAEPLHPPRMTALALSAAGTTPLRGSVSAPALKRELRTPAVAFHFC